MLVMVGSAAVKQLGYDLRAPNDIDYFATAEQDLEFAYERLGDVDVFYHPRLALWEWDGIATLDELYTIKVAHAYWDKGNWNKHMFDTMRLKSWGAKLIPDLHDLMYSINEEHHGKKKADLSQPVDEFFNDAVVRPYDHDSIHETVAYGDKPLFNLILKNPDGVAVSQDKFNQLDYEQKLDLVREECYATALERILIPLGTYGKAAERKAYSYALKALITSQSKGWFPTWIVDNFHMLRKADIDYVAKHKRNLHMLRPA